MISIAKKIKSNDVNLFLSIANLENEQNTILRWKELNNIISQSWNAIGNDKFISGLLYEYNETQFKLVLKSNLVVGLQYNLDSLAADYKVSKASEIIVS